MSSTASILVLSLVALTACGDQATSPTATPRSEIQQDAAKFRESGASVYWNGIAHDLIRQHNGSAIAAVRVFAILSTSQYNALIEAEIARKEGSHPSPGAAVVGASASALEYLFPLDSAVLEGRVTTQLSSPLWLDLPNRDASSGEQIGRRIATAVIDRAKADRFAAPFTGSIPVGPGIWFSSSNPPTPPIGATIGEARTYFLASGDQLRSVPPPSFGSADFLAALAEVRQISDTRTPEQIASASFWAFSTGANTPSGFWNDEASALALRYRFHERETAHLLAVMNMAAFDAMVGCFDAKFAYWFVRPTQADPLITLVVPLPNFPSYPSAHACVSGAESSILGAIFPAEKPRLDALAEAAALSRVFGGLHYRFDGEAGLLLGRSVADLALSMDVHGRKPFILK
jgi:hypothetical protein